MFHLAAPCPDWLKRAWIEWLGPEKVWELYAGTEAQSVTVIKGDEWLEHPGSVGKPIVGEMKILDPDGNELPPGEQGEVFMRPPEGVTTYRYIGAEAKSLDGWESLGDMGWMDEDGYLYLGDRTADMILAGGANIYPAEIEAALDAHPAVGSSCVIGLPDDDLGNRIHAIVQATASGRRRRPARPPRRPTRALQDPANVRVRVRAAARRRREDPAGKAAGRPDDLTFSTIRPDLPITTRASPRWGGIDMGVWHEVVKTKVAVAVVAAVSVTGIAAAGAVVSGGSEPSIDVGSTTTTTAPNDADTSTTTSTTVAAAMPVDEPTTTTAPPPGAVPVGAACETHGQRVSRVAHETPPGPGHGAAVSAAAHDHEGECGRQRRDGGTSRADGPTDGRSRRRRRRPGPSGGGPAGDRRGPWYGPRRRPRSEARRRLTGRSRGRAQPS